ncbi:MAG: hypothetical protein JWL83_2493 [Actinomycetia bacterium]|nr:hypothetical protein [Actinomycetes bacterium]
MTATKREWRGLVVLVAGTPWDGNMQFASHHVARHLTRYAPVLYVEPPQSPVARWRRGDRRNLVRSRCRVVEPRIAVLKLAAPPHPSHPVISPFARRIAHFALRRAVRSLDGDVQAVMTFAPATRMFGACGERIDVYYAKDDFSAAGDLLGRYSGHIGAAEEWAASHADLVVAHSPTLMERWEVYTPLFIPNGVDPAAFEEVDAAPLPSDVTLPRPIVGFVGHMSNRVDLSILRAIAASGRSLLIVGPRQSTFSVERIADLLARPNVQWVGVKPYDDLPSYLRVIDVGIVPYDDSAFNRASFPLKTLEYLAAGRPVVATGLPAVHWLGTDLVRIADDPDAFAGAVEAAIAEGVDDAHIRARREFARDHSWAARVRSLATAIGLPEPDDRSIDR